MSNMHGRGIITICVLVAAATEGALLQRWLSRDQLLTPLQSAAAADDRDETQPASGVDTTWFKAAAAAVDDTPNSGMYFSETKREFIVFGKALPAFIPTQDTTITSAPPTITSAPTTITSAPPTITSVPTPITCAPTTRNSAPIASTSAPSTSTRSRSTYAPLPSWSEIPSGYVYKPATESMYKLHEIYRTWYEANDTCASEDAHLVVINDALEVDIVVDIGRDAGYSNTVTWIGLRDGRPWGASDWRSVRGEPLNEIYHSWVEERPLDEGTRCAYLDASFDKLLFDEPCHYPHFFVCEISP